MNNYIKRTLLLINIFLFFIVFNASSMQSRNILIDNYTSNRITIICYKGNGFMERDKIKSIKPGCSKLLAIYEDPYGFSYIAGIVNREAREVIIFPENNSITFLDRSE